MMRLVIFAAALVGLGFLGVKGLNKAAPEIEARLEDKVVLNLAEEGHAWADVGVEGRAVTLTGATDTVESAESAISVAQQLWGVRKVDSSVEIKKAAQKTALVPYNMTVVKTPEQVKITGSVESEEAKERLLRIAHSNYGKDNVVADLKVAPNAPAGWRSAAGSVIFNIGQFEEATAELSETGLVVQGKTVEKSFGDHAERMMTQALPTGYESDFNIAVLDIEPAAGPSESLMDKILGAGDTIVAANTCAELAKTAKNNALFAFDSSMIRAEDKPMLQQLAKDMAGCARDNLVVHGHTDSTGPDLYNQWLSEQRALSGKRYLMTQGVAKDRIATVGHSEAKPTASNGTVEGRALNRRIEFKPVVAK